MTDEKTFDAQAHMRKIRTRQGMVNYLDVKYRVLWLRTEYPDASIITETIYANAEEALVKATVTYAITNAVGQMQTVMATAHGSETKEDFPSGHIEKAETKAIGRALATLGYGTDAALDFDDGEPLDGAGAAAGERAERRAPPPARAQDHPQATDAPAPAASTLPARRGVPASQSRVPTSRVAAQEANGRDVAWQKLLVRMDAHHITTGGVTTLAEAAEAIDTTAAERGMDVRVRRDADGTPAMGDLLNALLAFGPVR